VSTIEERLSRDIEAVTGGIIVTDSELRDAREAVEDRIEGGRQRDRRRGLVVAAAAAAVVVGVATWQGLSGDDASPSPAPPGPSTAALSDEEQEFLTGDALTTENLPGVWRLDNSRWLFMFTADGGFRYDETGRLSAHPRAYGTFALDGDTISVDIDGGSAGCAGKTIALRGVVSLEGPIHVLPVGSDPSSCGAPVAARWVLEPVLPAGYFSQYSNGPGVNWDPPADHDAVQGNWYDPTGGYLVELREDGTYSTITEPTTLADSGTWTVDPSVTRLTLVSGADSPTCREGDLFVLDNLRAKDFGRLNLQGDLGRNDCDVAWTGAGWLHLAP
jgi:hypothetical protein